MAYEQIDYIIPGLVASTNNSDYQHHFVVVTSTGTAVATAIGQNCDGVQQDKPGAANLETSVAQHGVSKVMAGGTVAVGAEVMSDASGHAITAAAAAFGAGPRYIMGRCLVGGDSGELISVLLYKLILLQLTS